MKTTKARRKFKSEFWQTNHYLITSLIGLDSIFQWNIKEKPKEFSTSWEPHNMKRSAVRSREFILKSFLWTTVDALDLYIRTLNMRPSLFPEWSKERTILETNQASVYRNVLDLWKLLGVNGILIALVRILITWRNNVIHYYARNKIDPQDRDVLQKNLSLIQSDYCGFIIDNNFFNRIENGDNLTFKEVASLIKASHRYVQDFDEKVIQTIDISEVCLSHITNKIASDKLFKSKYYHLIWKEREKLVKNVLTADIWINEDDYDKIIETYSIDKSKV
jgi:hypothetical protein